MSLKRHGKNNKPNAIMENSRHEPEYPSREELITQLAQLRSSLDGAYETLDSIAPSTDPDVTHKVSDMVDIINGLHECEFELMDLLAKDSHFASPAPSRVSDNSVDKNGEKPCDGPAGSGAGDNDVHSHATSQEDLSLYGAYAVSSSRPLRTSNDSTKVDKATDLTEAYSHIPPHHRLDYIKRLEEIQKVNERLVDRCRRLGLVLSRGFALDKNISTKMKEVKDIVATKEQAQRKILELKALMQQVTEDKLDTEISLSKIENDESYGRPYRFESRLASRGAASISPVEHHAPRPAEEENLIKKPRSFLGIVDSAEPAPAAPDYAQFLRGLRQPFTREHGERESAFVPIHNAAHHDATRDKKKCSSNIDSDHGDVNNEVKAPRPTANASLLRRVMEGGNPNPYSQNMSQLDQHRHGRSSSARASLVPPQSAGCNTMPSNLFRSNYSKSPPSMQSSSGIGSMNSRSMASLDNGRGELPPYLSHTMSRIASRLHEPDENIVQRGYPERSNMSSNNLNKSYRQPTRSSSFYSELDFRNQEVFPTMGWEDDLLHTHASPIRSRSPEFRRRILSTMESQQITDELNRVLRCRNSEESLPLPLSQQNWWSSSTELGQADRHPFVSDHANFMHRGKSLMAERTAADCYTQIMQLHVGIQEITQQIRNLNVSVAANKTATRDALLQHRFDMHNVTRCIRDVSDMISESMKRVEGQISNQTRLIMDIETRLRRVEDNQRVGSQKYESARETREREWQVPGRPDFMESQDLGVQYGHGGRDAISRERDNGQSGSILNNQIPPGTRANNYWDNFRSYSRQNMLSKSNANVPQFSHEASPSATENPRQVASDVLNNAQPVNNSQPAVSDLPGDSSRRNGNGKNLWATSGFYENMSTKKRNKDQKTQSTTLTSLSKSSGNGNVSMTNCSSTAEPLRSSRDSQPEPDDSNALSYNRETLHSQLSPEMSPFRRDSDSGPFSRLPDFEVPWPWPHSSSEERARKAKETERELENNRALHSTESGSGTEPQLSREARLDDNNPNSHLSAPKADRDKHMQNFKTRSSETLSNLDDSTSRNHRQEMLDGVRENDDAPDWVLNALEAVNSTSEFRSPVVSPLLRPVSDSNENNALELVECRDRETRESTSARSSDSPSTTVAMNIRCEESAITGDESVGRNGRRSSESASNNNI